ncbi:MAG: precorrin-6A reductase [Eubacteriales bacterium]|nr:precorrin-6A reductase [Eubacteriales bacterium]
MTPVMIFAGTVEGRTLSEFLSGQGVPVTACVATEYGETLLAENPYLSVHAGRMDQERMAELMKEQRTDLVIDATHPYAVEVSANVSAACASAGAEYVRLIREETQEETGGAVRVSSVDEAVEYLKGTEGGILATTGSKELWKYTAIPGYEKRVFARVLSTAEVAAACEKLGFVGKNLICMQGPFSEELNAAMLRQFDCRYLVTKETGRAGGFGEKIRAARKAGAKLVLVGRPPEQDGLSYEEVVRLLKERYSLRADAADDKRPAETGGAAAPAWASAGEAGTAEPEPAGESAGMPMPPAPEPSRRLVTLIGIGMGTPEGMTVEAADTIREADLLIGAGRMLEAAREAEKPVFAAYDPEKIAAYVRDHAEYRRIAVLLSGDIGFYSGAKRLYDALADAGCEIQSLCGISSVVYLCGKLKTPWEDVRLMSAHGRSANLAGAVRESAKTFTLLGAGDSVQAMCRELREYGLSHVTVHVGERLGYPDERITSGTPEELERGDYGSLCAALIENPKPFSGIRSCIGDEEFLRGKAPMTKSEVRSLSVAKLRLTRDAVVYDVGAGTGSVTVELALAAPDGMVYAVERNAEACGLIEENKRRFGTPNIQVTEGLAPEAMEALPAPTHAFIGGSAGNLKEILQSILAKNPSVRLVINTVTLETVAEVTECLKELPLIEEEIISVSIARAKKAGAYHLMMGQNPIYIVTCRGGGEP